MTEDKQQQQYVELQKLYGEHGLELIMTCGFAPELYNVFKDGRQIACCWQRRGEFHITVPDQLGKFIYSADTSGDGMFDDEERIEFMTNALNAIK